MKQTRKQFLKNTLAGLTSIGLVAILPRWPWFRKPKPDRTLVGWDTTKGESKSEWVTFNLQRRKANTRYEIISPREKILYDLKGLFPKGMYVSCQTPEHSYLYASFDLETLADAIYQSRIGPPKQEQDPAPFVAADYPLLRIYILK